MCMLHIAAVISLNKRELLNLANSVHKRDYVQGGPKSKPPPIFQKIALNIANEIRFLRKVKV